MILNLGIGIGGIVAATIVDVAHPDTFQLLYLMDAVTYLLYVLVLATLRGVGVGPAPVENGQEPEHGYREVLRDRRLLRVVVLGLVLMTCGYGSLEVGLPVIITVVNGLAVSWVAIAFAVNTATIVVVQLVSLKLITGRSRSRLLAVVAGLWAVSWLLLGFSGTLPIALAVIAICLSTAVFALGRDTVRPDHAVARQRSRTRAPARPLQRDAERRLGRVGGTRAGHRRAHAGPGPRGSVDRARRRRPRRGRIPRPAAAAHPHARP